MMSRFSPALWQLTCGALLMGSVASTALAQPVPFADNVPQIGGMVLDGVAGQPTPEGQEGREQDANEAVTVPDVVEWDGSLMFKGKRANDLIAIYEAYQLQAKGEDAGASGDDVDVAKETLERLAGINADDEKDAELDREIFRFALNSIVYHHARDWSIWVNGNRYGRQQALEGFQIGTSAVVVKDVSKNALHFVWLPKPESFPVVQQRWDAKQALKENDVPPPVQVARLEQVELDGINQEIAVTLRPNQTFDSNLMSVIEGSGKRNTAAPASSPSTGTLPNGGADGTMPNMDGTHEQPSSPSPAIFEDEEPPQFNEEEMNDTIPRSIMPRAPGL